MAVTDVVVEVGFGSTIFDSSPTWTAVSTYVRGLTTSRGRSSVDGRFGTGTGSLLLDNRDGRFSPENTAGAYYPDVTIGTPVRISESVSGEFLFYGSVRAWPPDYPQSGDSTVRVPLVDGFYNLNLAELGGEFYVQQIAHNRMGSVLTDVGWPAGLRDLDTGLSSMQSTTFSAPEDGGDNSALTHLQDVAEADVGVIFMSKDGLFTFKNRVASSGASAVFNFTDANMSAVTLEYNDDYLWNDVRVAREDGAQVSIQNSTSIATHGRRVLTKDVMPMSNDAEALNMAEWLSDIFGEQRLRVSGLTVKPAGDLSGALLTSILGLELRDMVNVTHVPETGDTINQDCAIERITHTLIPGDWTIRLALARLSTAETQDYWILGTSQLGTGTRLA